MSIYARGIVTDHLEPFRRIARSIRFVPPLSYGPQPYHHLTNAPPIVSLQHVITPLVIQPSPDSSAPVGPPVDPTDHTTALIRQAVSRPTRFPLNLTIQEDIGDRIGRLPGVRLPQDPVLPIAPQPRLPEPAPDWVAPSASLSVEPAELAEVAAVQVEQEAAMAAETAIAPALAQPNLAPVPEVEPEVVSEVEPEAEAAPEVLPEAETAPEINMAAATLEDGPPSEPQSAVSQWLGSVTDYLESVTHKLEQPTAANSDAVCPQCGSADLRKNGRRSGRQKYRCKSCNRYFVVEAPARAASLREKKKGFQPKRTK